MEPSRTRCAWFDQLDTRRRRQVLLRIFSKPDLRNQQQLDGVGFERPEVFAKARPRRYDAQEPRPSEGLRPRVRILQVRDESALGWPAALQTGKPPLLLVARGGTAVRRPAPLLRHELQLQPQDRPVRPAEHLGRRLQCVRLCGAVRERVQLFLHGPESRTAGRPDKPDAAAWRKGGKPRALQRERVELHHGRDFGERTLVGRWTQENSKNQLLRPVG